MTGEVASAIRGQRPPQVTGYDGFTVMEIIVAKIYRVDDGAVSLGSVCAQMSCNYADMGL